MYELIVFSSDVESLRKGIIKTSKNAPYTILLVGETGVGKSSVLELIANILTGNGLDHYDPDVLRNCSEQVGKNKHRQTNSAHLYEFTSKNGVMVRPGAFEHAEMCDPVPRFGSSTPLGWLTNMGGFSKMNSTKGAL